MSTPEQQQAYAQGYQVGYQHGQQSGAASSVPASGAYPVDLVAVYPESSSRLLMFFMFFKPFLLIPHMIVVWALGVAAGFVMIIAWFAVVIIGQYPKGLWEFMLGVQRWYSRVGAYMIGLTDQYPPFSLK